MDDDWKRQLDRLHEGLVRRDDPAEWVTEADAVRASRRYPHLMLRGPVFGLAAQDPGPSAPWRLVRSVTSGTPQEVRDGLNSLLWFRARDDTDNPAERRELLAAVALLEREPVDELTVLGGATAWCAGRSSPASARAARSRRAPRTRNPPTRRGRSTAATPRYPTPASPSPPAGRTA